MVADEAPEQTVPNLAPLAFLLVTHFEHVVGPRDVGLGGEGAAVGELRHAVDIGHHHPVVGIHKQLHEPFVNVIWADAAEHHEVAEQHQPLDVVTITINEDLLDHAVDGWDACGPVIEGLGHGSIEFPVVAIADLHAAVAIDPAHELAPADHLADEAFQRVERHFALHRERLVDDVLRIEQADVEHGRDRRMVDGRVLGADRVFVNAKVVEALGKEALEPLHGRRACHRPTEVIGSAGIIWEASRDVGFGFLHAVVG